MLRAHISFFFFILFFQSSVGQIQTRKTGKTHNVVWFTPSKAGKINGITVGPLESTIFDSLDQTINGITVIGAGMGILVPMTSRDPVDEFFVKDKTDDQLKKSIDSFISFYSHKIKHNGIVLSTFGIITGHVNGISISCFSGVTGRVNGIVINPMINFAYEVRGISIGGLNSSVKVTGIQIGIFNKAAFLKGLQIGIWNKTRKRRLPFINWG